MRASTYPGFDRITSDPAVMEGRPCIRGMRLTVQRVLAVLAQRPSPADLKADYPELEEEDVRQVLAFASCQVDERLLPVPAA